MKRREVTGFQNVTSDHFLHLQQEDTSNLSLVKKYDIFLFNLTNFDIRESRFVIVHCCLYSELA